jgi:uncharacterized protein
MLITIGQLRSRVENDCASLIAELQALTGRYGTEEAYAWENSLGKLSEVFQSSSFQPLHLYFGSRGNLALEYQLPASSSWCDVVLLGSHNSVPSATIIELKHWITRGDKPGRFEGLIERQGSQELHPSDQVRGYTEYCRRFHSAIADYGANVHGCVLFTRDRWADVYAAAPNQELAANYPLFTVSPEDINGRFLPFFKDRLTSPNEDFARAFTSGRYRQDRGFVAQIGAQILNPESEVFELLDNQRKAFTLCRAIVKDAFFRSSSGAPPKKVILIKGPPGSGKSVIAARLWASLVTDTKLPEGDIVFTTTSQSQNSNWSDLFDRTTGVEAASGVVRKATGYTPITTHRVGQLRRKHGADFLSDVESWRDHLATLQALGEPYRDGAMDNQNLVSLVDEAHALINSEHPEGRGQFGFATTLGPQGYHIIRSSLLTVFFLDPLQGFRQRENTSIEDIRRWSKELGAGDPEEISLEGTQFRCAGSAEYVAWIESVLGGANVETNKALAGVWNHTVDPSASENEIVSFPAVTPQKQRVLMAAENAASYQISANASNVFSGLPRMDFRIFDNPEKWESELRLREAEGSSVRLLSTYSRAWRTEGAANPHALSPKLMDFNEPYEVEGGKRTWSRIWNFVPRNGSDYTWYVTGHPAGHIAKDPLCEVGCPYAVRGFDYDYVGILWLNDLIWNDGQWRVDPNVVEESGIKNIKVAARREMRTNKFGPATAELLERVTQAYRILFTRALKGVYVWVPDHGTRDYLLRSHR